MAENPPRNQLSHAKLFKLGNYLGKRRDEIERESPTMDVLASEAAVALGFDVTGPNIVSVLEALGIEPSRGTARANPRLERALRMLALHVDAKIPGPQTKAVLALLPVDPEDPQGQLIDT